MESLFESIATRAGLPLDQVRYIVLLSLGYPLGALYRYVLKPTQSNVTLRHIISTSIGLLFGLMCFGWVQMGILFSVTGVCYAMLVSLPTSAVHLYTMLFALVSLSVAHVYRMVTDYEGWHLDFTGPLMLIVQRVTLTAFALRDGVACKEAELNEDQKLMKLMEVPSLLEYWSYNYNFHTFLAGPTCTLKEYLNFVDGSNFKTTPTQNGDGKVKTHGEPSFFYPVIGTLLGALVCIAIHLVLVARYPLTEVIAPHYSIPQRVLISHIVGLHIRTRYYFIWLFVESINNYIGLGFSGYDKKGKPVWNVCKNINVFDVEFGTNYRALITAWNVTTSLWLRRVCYERLPPKFILSRSMSSYLLSAIWHGFYPGYYLSFLCAGFMNEAARKMRRLLNRHFQDSVVTKRVYDVITTVTTVTINLYAAICFPLLSAESGLKYWSYFYYVPLMVVVVITVVPLPDSSDSSDSKEKSAHNGGAAATGKIETK
ncbi:hypothetical protein EMCRGX_G014362 [Ephydatia muelleri]